LYWLLPINIIQMQVNDFINGCFELTSGLFCAINIFKLVKDKTLKGVSWIPIGFFTIWGVWNLYYYTSLSQPLSVIGGVGICISNTIWLILVFYYKRKEKTQQV
jgi:hypothetical protein